MGVYVCVCSMWGREQGVCYYSLRALVVVSMEAVYLTVYSDCLTGFHEPLFRYLVDVAPVRKMSSAIAV